MSRILYMITVLQKNIVVRIENDLKRKRKIVILLLSHLACGILLCVTSFIDSSPPPRGAFQILLTDYRIFLSMLVLRI